MTPAGEWERIKVRVMCRQHRNLIRVSVKSPVCFCKLRGDKPIPYGSEGY
jgi:hypothetical protein